MSDINLPQTRSFPGLPEAGPSWTDLLSSLDAKIGRMEEMMEARSMRRGKQARRSQVLEEIEKERGRIARELHAGAGQPISGIRLNLEILRECSPVLPERGREALRRLDALTDQALQQVRAVSHRLHPPAWAQFATAEAIALLLRTSGVEEQFQVTLSAKDLAHEPDHATKTVLYRCAQECLSNIVRHSGATEIRIELYEERDAFHLRVQDNGRGFDPAQVSGGIGLEAIREHCVKAGGISRIHTGESGTEIIISIPQAVEE